MKFRVKKNLSFWRRDLTSFENGEIPRALIFRESATYRKNQLPTKPCCICTQAKKKEMRYFCHALKRSQPVVWKIVLKSFTNNKIIILLLLDFK